MVSESKSQSNTWVNREGPRRKITAISAFGVSIPPNRAGITLRSLLLVEKRPAKSVGSPCSLPYNAGMKVFCTGWLTLALAGSAWASFDMMLVSNFQTRQIHRYDPQNGVYLGAFDAVGAPTSLVVNQATQEVYVLTEGFLGTGIARYNYHTGDYLGLVALPTAWGVPTGMGRGSSGEVVISAGRDVYRVNPLTGAQIGSAIFFQDRAFTYPTRAGYLAEGNYLVYGNSDGTVWTNDFLMAISPSGSWQGSWMAPPVHTSNIPRDMVTRGNDALSLTQTPSAWQLHLHRRTNSAVFSGLLLSDFDGTRSYRTVEWGHNANGYVTFVNPTTSIAGVRAFGTVLGNLGPERTMSFTNRIDGTAIVLAPEPGTVAALGIGVATLLRRKRRSASPLA